jgi:CBS domain-containing protein
MLVKEVMIKDVKTIRSTDTVKQAAKIMNDNNIGCLVVVSGSGGVIGIITEWDILEGIVVNEKDANNTKVEEVMTKELVVIDPEKSLEEAADVMTEKDIRRLPVVSGNRLVGIVTASDLVAHERKLIERISKLLVFAPPKRIGG